MLGEKESLRGQRLFMDHRWRIAEISLGVRKPKRKIKQHLHHHMLFGRVSRKIHCFHPRTNSNKFTSQTQLELQTGLISAVR